MPTIASNFTALVCLLPALLLVFRAGGRRDLAFWGAVLLAVFGPGMAALSLLSAHWVTGLAPALWVSCAATAALFAFSSLIIENCWRLLPLVAPYLMLVGVLATVWQGAVGQPVAEAIPDGWLIIHIVVGVLTYAFLSLAALAALAAFLQERSLKRKRPGRLPRQLPAMAESEHLSTSLLVHGEGILAIGVVSGMALDWIEHHRFLVIDHKTLLSLLAFAVVGGLLIAKHRVGIRGRAATRLILLAWLLVTLAYPGVKFVTEILLS